MEGTGRELAAAAESARILAEAAGAFDGYYAWGASIGPACRDAVAQCDYDGVRWRTPGHCLTATQVVTASLALGERSTAALYRLAVRLFVQRRLVVLDTEGRARIRDNFRRYAEAFRPGNDLPCGTLLFRDAERTEFEAIITRREAEDAALYELLRVEYGDDFVR